MKRYSNIQEVWSDLDQGTEIFWTHEGYKVYQTPSYDKNHFSVKNGQILSVRYIETYWGSLIVESDIEKLFSKGSAS